MPADAVPPDVDVAFSFMARDEELALELARSIQGSAGTFVYSERQKDLAGTDGVVQFTSLFENRARLVVVLFRQGYGTTKWTRIEESAITSRGVNLGWDSLLLISLDGTKPTWLPASRLWYGIEQFGLRTAAEVVLARLRDLFQAGRPETLVEQARAVSRRLASKAKADLWRRSEEGVTASRQEIIKLRAFLQEQAEAISMVSPDLRMEVGEPQRDVILLRLGRARTSFAWTNAYLNTLDDAYLFVREQVLIQRDDFEREWEPIREVHMGLWLGDGDVPLWIADEDPGRSFTTRELAESHIKRLLDHVKARLDEERG